MEPMPLQSLLYLSIFLPVSVLVVHRFHGAGKKAALLLFSIFFWYFLDPNHFLWALILCLLNVVAAKAVSKKGPSFRHRSAIICSLASLVFLALCKFSVMDSPVGFSFLIFSIVSFQTEGEKDGDGSWSILDGFLYLSFFPKLTMGPIVRFSDFCLELKNDEAIDRVDLDAGARQCIHGLFKKAVLADLIGEYADLAFARTSQLTTAAAWVGLLLYALQLYYDFSGYSDLAIGSARLFGFRFEKNFDHPYLSTSLTDFWRRWHISLGAWFRNYLYFPLGGSWKGMVRTCMNLLIVFLATGLWHGEGWTFVLWGLFHGVVMIVERIGLRRHLSLLPHWVQVVYCDLMVCLGWVLFRSSTLSDAGMYYGHLFGVVTGTTLVREILPAHVLVLMIAAIAGAGGFHSRYKTNAALRNVIDIVLLVAGIAGLYLGTGAKFIYAQF